MIEICTEEADEKIKYKSYETRKKEKKTWRR